MAVSLFRRFVIFDITETDYIYIYIEIINIYTIVSNTINYITNNKIKYNKTEGN